MKKITLLAVFALSFACLNGCGKKAVQEEPALTPAATVVIEEKVVQVTVDPAVEAASQKYAQGLDAFNKGNYKGALKYWQECLKLDPKNDLCQRGVYAANDSMRSLAASVK